MGAGNAELKIVVSIVEQSQAAVESMLNNLKGLLVALKGIDQQTLNNAAAQIQHLKDTVATATEQVGKLSGNSGLKTVVSDANKLTPAFNSVGSSADKLNTKEKALGKNSGVGELGKKAEEGKTSFLHFNEGISTTGNLTGRLSETFRSVGEALEFMLGGFLALESIKFFKEAADAAAREQLLADAVHAIGANAGYTKEQIDKATEAVTQFGITDDAARKTLARFIQAGLDISKIGDVAKLSADAAALMGTDISSAFESIDRSIEAGYPRMLRMMGIVVDQKQAFDDYAKSINKVPSELSQMERGQALLNAVVAEGAKRASIAAAAQGDVGLSLLKIPAAIEKIKEDIGGALLPAYAALVQTFLDFLKDMDIASGKENEHSKAAQDLGFVVKTLATGLKDLLEVLIEYRGVLLVLLGTYVLMRVANLSMIGDLISLSGAFTSADGAALAFDAVLTKLKLTMAGGGEGAGLLATLLRGLGAVVVTVLGAFALFGDTGSKLGNAFVGWFAGPIAFVIKAVYEFLKALTDLTVTGLRVVYDLLVKGDWTAAGHVWDGFQKRLRETWADLKGFIDDWWKLTSGTVPTGKAGAGAVPQTRPNLFNQTDQILTSLGIRDAKQAEKTRSDLSDLFGNKFQFGPTGAQSGEFAKTFYDFGRVLDDFRRPVEGARVSTNQLKQGLQELASAAKTPADLKAMVQAVQEYKKATGDAGFAGQALAVATQAVSDSQKQFTAKLVAEAKTMYKAVSDAKVEAAKHDLELTKTANQVAEDADKEKYAHGLLTLDEYYARREQRIRDLGQKEVEIQKQQTIALLGEARFATSAADAAQIKEQIKTQLDKLQQITGQKEVDLINSLVLELEKDFASTTSPQLRAQIQAQIKAAQAQLQSAAATDSSIKVPLSSQVDVQLSQAEQQKAQEELNVKREILQLDDQVQKFYQGEIGSIQAINDKYDQMEQKLKGVKGATEAIEAARTQEIFKAQIEEANRALQNQLALETAGLNLAKAKVSAQENRGLLTQAESIEARAKIAQQEINIAQQELSGIADQVRRTEAERAVAEQNLRAIYIAAGLSEQEINQKVADGLKGLDDQLVALKTRTVDLQAHIIDLGAQIEQYGDQLRRSFTDSLSQAIDDIILKSKSVKSALNDLIKSFKAELAKEFSQNVAQFAVKGIINFTSKKDDQGNPIAGTSIFDSLGKLVGLKGAKFGESRGKPLYTEVTNLPGGAGGLNLPGLGGTPPFLPGLSKSPGIQDALGVLNGNSSASDEAQSVQKLDDATTDLESRLGKMPDSMINANKQGAAGFFAQLKTGFGGIFSFLKNLFSNIGSGIGSIAKGIGSFFGGLFHADGGLITGPGTGRSDSIPAMLSNGEHIMPADKTKESLPLLEAIRSGKVDKAKLKILQLIATGVKHAANFADGGVVSVYDQLLNNIDLDALQSIAPSRMTLSLPTQRVAEQASVVRSTAQQGPLMVQLHPETMRMTMQEWFEREMVRQHGRR